MFTCKYDKKCKAIDELTKARKENKRNLEQFCRTAVVAIQNKWIEKNDIKGLKKLLKTLEKRG